MVDSRAGVMICQEEGYLAFIVERTLSRKEGSPQISPGYTRNFSDTPHGFSQEFPGMFHSPSFGRLPR